MLTKIGKDFLDSDILDILVGTMCIYIRTKNDTTHLSNYWIYHETVFIVIGSKLNPAGFCILYNL